MKQGYARKESDLSWALGLLNPSFGAILVGLGMGIGAILLGGRVLETVGKEITEICILRGDFR